MSAGMNSGNGQDFDLNLAPIIDCFTVLIAFMLVSASFLSIGLLDAGVAGGAVQSDAKPPSVDVTITLKAGHRIEIQTGGKSNEKYTLTEAKGEWDYDTLNSKLDNLKKRWPDVSAITLTAEDGVEYQDIVSTMEKLRKQMPFVMLGGF